MSIKISGTIAWPARVITQLAQFEDPGFRASVEGASRGEIVFGTTPIPSSCQAPSALGLDATATDLRSIAAVQAEFGPMKDLMGLRPLISRLMGLPLTTTLGKVIRSRIVTIYAVRADWWGKPADMDWLHATLDLERNKAGFLAQDYGRLIGMRAIATISLPPESQNRPELHRLFALSRYYDPGFTLNRSAEGELYMNEGKCSEAIALVSPPPATVIELGWDPLASWGNRTRIAVLREAQKKQAEGNCP